MCVWSSTTRTRANKLHTNPRSIIEDTTWVFSHTYTVHKRPKCHILYRGQKGWGGSERQQLCLAWTTNFGYDCTGTIWLQKSPRLWSSLSKIKEAFKTSIVIYNKLTKVILFTLIEALSFHTLVTWEVDVLLWVPLWGINTLSDGAIVDTDPT